MCVLGVILARAGSKGLPDKCVKPLLGRAVIDYTFDHALSAVSLDDIVFTTDSVQAAALARSRSVRVIDRPAELAHDTATVDAVARHAVETFEAEGRGPFDVIVLLYGNIPVRAAGVIDRVVEHLIDTSADSVRTVAPVTKLHPDWLHRLDGDRMVQYRENSIYRRQDLSPLYYHDGAVLAVTRDALFTTPAHPGDFHAFLGSDRRAVIQEPHDAVDVDDPVDLYLAEAILRSQRETVATH
jgi:CMP-N-acetylneuraminic acid synthetase